MKKNSLENIFKEEQLEESILYLRKKIEIIDNNKLVEMNKSEELEIDLKNILYNKNSTKIADPNHELFSPVSQSVLFKNEAANKKVEKLKAQIDQKKLLCMDLDKEKAKVEIIISYLDKLEKIKNKSEDEGKYKENKERQYMELGLQVFEAQENEKKRIARDLHDTTVQNLVSMIHKLELCTKVMDSDEIRAKLELQVMIKTLHTTINEMRNIIYDLRPMSVDDIGLVATVERFVKQMNINNLDVNITLEVINKEIDFIPLVNLNIFRVIQESCANAIKSGKAAKIDITLDYEIDIFFITILDNGVGFSYNDNVSESTKNFGLSIMKERISILKGNVIINSVLGEGTTIKIEVPIAANREMK